ncbi:MAG: hypothetical protein BGO41_09345 [Clostridiales bacterium 38-18]|nr:MAG: hypothetical protein BGO41_09345 [Clostridiales bacterium 38-18]
MIIEYDKKYNKPKYKHVREKIEKILKEYLYENFKDIENVSYILLSKSAFTNGIYASVDMDKSLVKLNFDM